MLKGKERQMVLDYLYQECVAASQVPSKILKRTGCMLEAKMKYENITKENIIKIYSQLLEKKIINYLIDNITNSLVLYWVNGSPKKREIRINEYVQNQYRLLSKAEKIAICEKLKLTYLS